MRYLVFCLTLLCVPVFSQAAVIYVKADASGGNDGTSWADAHTSLQAALSAAAPGDDLWVAAGTYLPTQKHGGTHVRNKAFQLKNATRIFGGFSGRETHRTERDWENNPTVLSGDIGAAGDPADNCLHVFYHPVETLLDHTALLDGFTIAGGNANSSSPHDKGGGMYNDTSSPTLRNCTFRDNAAGSKGGGVYNLRSTEPVFTHCTFAANTTGLDGGGIYNDRSDPLFSGCSLIGNTAARDGGAMYNLTSTPTLANCLLADNTAGVEGGGMKNNASHSVVVNSTFSGNAALAAGGGVSNRVSSPVVTNCIFWEDSAPSGREIHNSSAVSSPQVTYSDIAGGYTGTANISEDPMFADPASGDYHLRYGSPCIDTGTAQGGPDNDGDGDARPLLAAHDMGMDEFAHWYGDFDADQDIDLADPILCLQVVTGIPPAGFVFHASSDVDTDGRTGLPDAVFDAQVLAGLRPHPDFDADRDGYSPRNGDCAENDGTVSPAAAEICGDGVDQDCDEADAACTPAMTYLDESFTDDAGGFFEAWGYAVDNGQLRFQGDGSETTSVIYWNGGTGPSDNWHPQPGDSNYFDDFHVSVTTHWESGDPQYIYGLALCISRNSLGTADWIRFVITRDGYFVVAKIVAGSYEIVVDWEPTFVLDITGQHNRLGVQKDGYQYRFFLNGYEVAQATITDFEGGAIGLESAEKLTVAYDDYRVTDPYQGRLVVPSEGYRVLRNELIYKNMTSAYLWYDQVPAVSYQDYASAGELLDDLKYSERDRWSYVVSREEHDSLFEEGRFIGVGMGTTFHETDTSLWVTFVYPSSPASEAGLQRGDRLLAINGKTIAEIEAEDLWGTIFGPHEIGVAVSVEAEKTGRQVFPVNMEKAWVDIRAVLHTSVIPIAPDNKVGYMVFNEFIGPALDDLDAAFTMFRSQGIDELVLDLRYNPGGQLSVAGYMAERTVAPGNREIFVQLSHNDRYRDAWDGELSMNAPAGALGLNRLFVITTGQSCSASEALINGLSPYMSVIVIGGTTCGKPVGMHGYDIFDLHLSSIEFEVKNAEDAGGYFDGLAPTCTADDDLGTPLGDEAEGSLAEALHYIRHGACSEPPLPGETRRKPPAPRSVMKGFRRVVGAF